MGFNRDIFETPVTRKSALAVLASGPQHRRELQEELEISKATCHRIIRSFDDQGLLQRTENGYELSELGRIVSEQVSQFEATVRTAHEMEPLLDGIAASAVDFDIELFTDANIVLAQANDPYPPVERFIELFRESDTLRNLGPTPVPPTMANEVFDLMFNEAKKVDVIKPYSVIAKYITEYEDYMRKAAGGGYGGLRIQNDLSFGLSLYDNHIGLRGYDLDTGTVLVFVDTDDPEAVAWGEDVFEYYREQSTPLSQFEEFPEWAQKELTHEIE